VTVLDAIKTKTVMLTQPKRGYFNLCVTEYDGTFIRYEISLNDVRELVARGADMSFRYTEEMS
jgi:hypothetical protein